jgi:acetyl esterase/lipase
MRGRAFICPVIWIVALMARVGIAYATDPTPQPVLLWPNGAPGATGASDEDKPAITAYLPDAEHNTGAAILICPGGGFSTRCTDFEGTLVANWLRPRGVAGFILRYRIRPLYGAKEWLADAQRGMQYVRSHAQDYHISPDRIGIIGFSAGADLAANTAMRALSAKGDSADPIERVSSRPDFLILGYGSAAMPAMSADAPQGDHPVAPPTFMFCTAEDASHLNGMLALYTALRRQRVPAEVHFFQNGEHGVGFAQGDPVLGEWPLLMLNWIRANGFLAGQPRLAVRGLVKLDGEPLARGSVIFTPIDIVGAPPAIGYVFNTGPVRGEYAIGAAQGLVPGKYRVEVRQDAQRWLSNSRDPMQLGMNQKQRSGAMTDDDRKAYSEWARKRDLSPSIQEQRVYGKNHPGDAAEMVVEVKPGSENHIDVEVTSR